MGTIVPWRCGGGCWGRRRGYFIDRTEMVICGGHGGLGTERVDKINEFLYSFTDKRSKTPVHRFGSDESLPTGFHLYTCPACFISDLDRMGHQLRQRTGHRVSLCDRNLGTQIIRKTAIVTCRKNLLTHPRHWHNGTDGDVNSSHNIDSDHPQANDRCYFIDCEESPALYGHISHGLFPALRWRSRQASRIAVAYRVLLDIHQLYPHVNEKIRTSKTAIEIFFKAAPFTCYSSSPKCRF